MGTGMLVIVVFIILALTTAGIIHEVQNLAEIEAYERHKDD